MTARKALNKPIIRTSSLGQTRNRYRNTTQSFTTKATPKSGVAVIIYLKP
ncbi:hypothetical protein LV85_00800 [Algoriphagus chordae]|uniref:Uncharacterized protein n=1 Tax=Algoriphagus chordae TaxID=237019 RepID=A0A2W7RXC4_9BACT|nr:hypothetical protein LV85_00800 [Algoriphagus chordae]